MVLTATREVTLDLADIRDSRVKALFFFNTANNWKNLTKSDKNWSRSLRSSTSSWNALYRRQTWWSIWASNSTSMNGHKGLLKSLMIPCYTSMHDQIILQQLFVQILKISTTELAYYLVMKRFAIKKKKCTKMH